MPRTVSRRRKKVSAKLSSNVIKYVKAFQREAGLASFSATVEYMLWRQMLAERERNYYLNMTEEDRAEQERWVRFATEQTAKTLGRD